MALRRQPILFWALALTAAVSTYWAVDSALGHAARGADAYGELVPVAVAERSIAAGDTIDGDAVAIDRLPARLVPDDALADVPTGRTARHDIVAGEALVRSRVAPEGAEGVAAMLATGERAAAIPTDRHRAPVRPGQRVDVLATVDPAMASGREPTTVVAEAARVLTVTDEGLTVAVDATDAGRVATALASAVVTVVVAPG